MFSDTKKSLSFLRPFIPSGWKASPGCHDRICKGKTIRSPSNWAIWGSTRTIVSVDQPVSKRPSPQQTDSSASPRVATSGLNGLLRFIITDWRSRTNKIGRATWRERTSQEVTLTEEVGAIQKKQREPKKT